MYLCLLLLVVVLLVCHSVAPFKVNEGTACLSSCASSSVHLFASFSWIFHLDIYYEDKPCAFCD